MTHVHEHYVYFTFQCSWHTIMVIKDGELYNIELIMLLHIIRYEDMLNIYGLYKDMILDNN